MDKLTKRHRKLLKIINELRAEIARKDSQLIAAKINNLTKSK